MSLTVGWPPMMNPDGSVGRLSYPFIMQKEGVAIGIGPATMKDGPFPVALRTPRVPGGKELLNERPVRLSPVDRPTFGTDKDVLAKPAIRASRLWRPPIALPSTGRPGF